MSSLPRSPSHVEARHDIEREIWKFEFLDLVVGADADTAFGSDVVADHLEVLQLRIAVLRTDDIGVDGRCTAVDADIVSAQNGDTELQNFKVISDDIAAEGGVGVGADNKIKEFEFPNFTLNVVSSLDMQGVRGKDNIWSIKIKGSNYDGRSFSVRYSTSATAEEKVKLQECHKAPASRQKSTT